MQCGMRITAWGLWHGERGVQNLGWEAQKGSGCSQELWGSHLSSSTSMVSCLYLQGQSRHVWDQQCPRKALTPLQAGCAVGYWVKVSGIPIW